MPTSEKHCVIVEVQGGLVTDVVVPDSLVLPLLVRDYDPDGSDHDRATVG